MEPPKLLGIVLTVAFLFQIAFSAKQAVVSRKSKLCGNAECEEVLFKARVKRVMGINNDPSFLNLAENAIISVVAVKFSDRPDIMEGKLNGEGDKGFFYAGAIDILPFAEFLRAAIDEKKEMLMISQNPADTGDNKIVGFVHSETDLVRDFNAKNAQAAAENGLPPPTPLPIPEPAHTGHGHSHGGHGHSHGGHGHSHGSHGHPAPTPAPTPAPEPVKLPEVVPQVVAETQNPAPEVAIPEAQKPVPEVPNLNNVLGNPPKIGLSEMDLEIERMIREEEERLKQEPLVLKSLPAEPIKEVVPEPEVVTPAPEAVTPAPVVPEVIPEAVTPAPTQIPPEPIAQYIPEPTTTPTPEVAAPNLIPEVPHIPVPVPTEEPLVFTTTPAPVPQAQEPVVQEQAAPEVVAQPIQTEELTTPSPAAPEVVQHAPEASLVPEDPTPTTPTTTPPPSSPDEEEFLKWEEERKRRDAAAEVAPQSYEDAQGHQFQGIPGTPPQASAGLFDLIRSSLALGNITDASVLLYLNLTFVLASLLVYIIVRSLSSGGESDVLDRQAYFALVTKHKQLQLQLQATTAQVQNLQANGVQQQQQAVNHEPELLALRQQVNHLQNELQTAHSQRQEFEHHYNQLREISDQKEQQIGQLNETANTYKERIEKSSTEIQEWARQLDSVRAELNETHQTAYTRQQELIEKQQENDRIQTRIQELTVECRGLTSRIAQLEEANDKLEIELKDLKSENTGLLQTIQQLEKDQSQDAAESGGSGWSDFGEMDEIDEKKEEKKTVEADEKTPDASLNDVAEIRAKYKKYGEDMEELSQLKVKFADSEKELQRYRNLYEKLNEKENRGAIEIELKLKNAESDLLEAKRKIEELTVEKKELGDRLNEMFKNLNTTMTKSTENDKLLTQLREEAFAKEKKLLDIDSVIRKKDEKIRELDEESKRVQREYTKLETRSFYDVMKLKKELDDFKTQQILPPRRGGDILGGGPVSLRPGSDRVASPLENPIWDEPDYPSNPPPHAEDYFSSGSIASRRRSTRRSILHQGLNPGAESPSDQEKSSKSSNRKEGPTRRRSRSQGRQLPAYSLNDPYAYNQYMPGSSDSSFMSMGQQQQHPQQQSSQSFQGGFQPLSGRHSKSGHHLSGHYSSGGSNGGRSPPPEMPLLSAIPPPGARKPMSKRPDSAHHLGK